jgi:hypothetical protein
MSTIKANLEEQTERRIVYDQLVELGINPSQEEFELHFKIAKYALFDTKELINTCYQWLVKLDQANNESQRYPVRSFRKILAQRFIIICGNSGLGLWALYKFFEFPIANLSSLSFKDAGKLVVKSFIKWQGKKK